LTKEDEETPADSSSRMKMEYRCEWVVGEAARDALEVRRRVYIEEFGFDLGGSGPGDEIDRRADHLVAKNQSGEAVASLRLLDASARPFEIERFLNLEPHLGLAWHPAEITRLCILGPYRRITHASFVHLALLRAILQLTRERGITHIVAWTRRELMPFYRYVLFDVYEDVTFTHPGIGDAIHTLVILDLGAFPDRCRIERPTLYHAVSDALECTAGR
jgi:hypothetical protein